MLCWSQPVAEKHMKVMLEAILVAIGVGGNRNPTVMAGAREVQRGG